MKRIERRAKPVEREGGGVNYERKKESENSGGMGSSNWKRSGISMEQGTENERKRKKKRGEIKLKPTSRKRAETTQKNNNKNK